MLGPQNVDVLCRFFYFLLGFIFTSSIGHIILTSQTKENQPSIMIIACQANHDSHLTGADSHLTDYNGNWQQEDYSSRMSDSQTGKDDASTIAHYLSTFSSSHFSAHKGQLLVVWTASLN